MNKAQLLPSNTLPQNLTKAGLSYLPNKSKNINHGHLKTRTENIQQLHVIENQNKVVFSQGNPIINNNSQANPLITNYYSTQNSLSTQGQTQPQNLNLNNNKNEGLDKDVLMSDVNE